MIEALFKAFQIQPMVWWRQSHLQREEFILLLGLGLAPLLAIKDQLHGDQNIWATAAVVFTLAVLGVTAFGTLCSILLNSGLKPKLNHVVAFGSVFVKTNLFLGLVFLFQRMEFSPDVWSPAADWLASPTPVYLRVLYNLSCIALPVLIVGTFGYVSLKHRHSLMRSNDKPRATKAMRKEFRSFFVTMSFLTLSYLLLLEILLWWKLPEWLAPILNN